MTDDISSSLEPTLTEFDILFHGITTVRHSIENIISLLTRDTMEDSRLGGSSLSKPLLLSTLHGLSLQLQEIQHRLDHPYLFTNEPNNVDQEIKNRILQSNEEVEELRTQVKVQQERLRNLESEERMAGFREKISRMEADLDTKDAEILYYKELERQIVINMKRSRKKRKNLSDLRKISSEIIASNIVRDHEECKNCANRYEMPPICKGHLPGNIECTLFSPKGYTEKE